MPQRIYCSRCGSVLYDGVELEPPMEVIQRHDGICPRCGKRLVFDLENLRIAPFRSG